MKRNFLFLLVLTSLAVGLDAAPTPTPGPKRTTTKNEQQSVRQRTISEQIALSANGWSYTGGEWVHPQGYKFENGRVLRTTARPGRAFPKPPGKFALENAPKLAQKPIPKTNPVPDTRTAAEKAAEIRRKNLTPIAAPQTGSHL